MSTLNYYRILGISTAATNEEIRRAYRVLARRYHPDVNPGKRSEETFKQIAEAYETLSDAGRRKQYDLELERSSADYFGSAFERAHEAYRKQQRTSTGPQQKHQQQSTSSKAPPRHAREQGARKRHDRRPEKHVGRVVRLSREAFKTIRERVAAKVSALDRSKGARVSQISIIEVSVSIFEAIRGIRRTVEVSDEGGKPRKISVTIPPGVRSGSVVRCRRKEDASEEVVLIVRVAAHPWLSISHKGLLMDIPITISEALQGARIQVPSLGEPLLVTVEPGTQSGTEVRLRNHGVIHRDGTRGDLFVRFMIRVPDSLGAVGLTAKAVEIDPYYAGPIRASLPKSLLEA